MDKIKALHTDEEISYYYTEKMKKDGLVFVLDGRQEEKGKFRTSLELVVVKSENAIIYTIYDGEYKGKIEIYMMVKAILDQYETDDFLDFVNEVSSGRMESNAQRNEESKREIYSWLYGRFNNFLYSCN